MSDLKKKLIRLAYQKPHLRGDLLPLIQKQAARSEHYALTVARANDKVEDHFKRASKRWAGSFKYPLGDMLPVEAEDLEQELRLLLARKWNVDVKVVSDFKFGGYGLRVTDTTKTLDGLAKKISDGLYQDTVKTLKSIGKAVRINMRVVQRENLDLIKAAQKFR